MPEQSSLVFAITVLLFASVVALGQSGDQVVDGIGETSLIARYPLDGNSNDTSRDNHTATVLGSALFIDDAKLGKVLSLPGTPESGLLLPSAMLRHADSVTVTAWIRLQVTADDQELFSFGSKDGHRLVMSLTGGAGSALSVFAPGQKPERIATAAAFDIDRWVHASVVIDGSARKASIFLDGQRVGQSPLREPQIDVIFGVNQQDNRRIHVGANLKGLLHDLRIYAVPLTDVQIATIYRNGRPNPNRVTPTTHPASPSTKPTIINFGGPTPVRIPDIAVTTPVGQLPVLPTMIDAVYENAAEGPQVRVIWPSPKAVDSVLQPGSYPITGRVSGTALMARAVVQVTAKDGTKSSPVRLLESFPLSQVTLDKDEAGQDTPYIKNRDKFLRGLVLTNPDDFLYMFRDAFGQTQPDGARPLGVWDAQTVRLRGHATGHYLSALAQAYASSGHAPELQDKFFRKLTYTVDVLHDLAMQAGTRITDPAQVPPGPGRTGYDSDLRKGHLRTDVENWGLGFISAYPPDQFILLEQGATYGTRDNQIWAPYYTLHKILAGLLDCYEITGNKKALVVAQGMSLWCYERLKVLSPDQRAKMWNRYIAGEYGGMNEVLARLSRLTGDRRLLEAAQLFDNSNFFFGGINGQIGLAANVDLLRGKHANQHIPQVIGALETYASTGEEKYLQVAEHFWQIATNSYTYSIGGVAGARTPANAECFTAEPDTLAANGFSESGQNETCATYNMLKLSRGLFMYHPDRASYMDYYERAMLNDILASVAEHDAGNTYHIPLNPGARKSFSNADMMGFTCCNGTALESNTKFQDSIYFKQTAGEEIPSIYVNLFFPSTLNWKERGAVVKQQTQFPYSDRTRLTLQGTSGVNLRVRVPGWATQGFFVHVNGRPKPVAPIPGRYLDLGNVWKDGDVIDLRMPFSFRLDRVVDQPNLASLFYGPVVLAAQERDLQSNWRPLLLDTTNLQRQFAGDASKLTFKFGNLNFLPFFESYGRYSVYFDVRPAAGSATDATATPSSP